MATAAVLMLIVFGAFCTSYLALFARRVYQTRDKVGSRPLGVVLTVLLALCSLICFTGCALLTVGFVMNGD